jgi:hypothetical protein
MMKHATVNESKVKNIPHRIILNQPNVTFEIVKFLKLCVEYNCEIPPLTHTSLSQVKITEYADTKCGWYYDVGAYDEVWGHAKLAYKNWKNGFTTILFNSLNI